MGREREEEGRERGEERGESGERREGKGERREGKGEGRERGKERGEMDALISHKTVPTFLFNQHNPAALGHRADMEC